MLVFRRGLLGSSLQARRKVMVLPKQLALLGQ
nr:MAG TPA: hypothetical protein [Caudoviricetes sp.]